MDVQITVRLGFKERGTQQPRCKLLGWVLCLYLVLSTQLLHLRIHRRLLHLHMGKCSLTLIETMYGELMRVLKVCEVTLGQALFCLLPFATSAHHRNVTARLPLCIFTFISPANQVSKKKKHLSA